MTKILLSFCIPTYNRPERIDFFLNQFISTNSNEIELIIGNDNPLCFKTKKTVEKYNDPRIQYFKNKNNLGLDGNLIKIIHKAKGEYVFINMDDDDIEMNEIPWILEIIKNNKNLAQIRGSIGMRKTNEIYGYYGFENKRLKQGIESISEMAFSFAQELFLKENF
ncbi:MAG: glycosyltransferase [Candidatus Lokiarchaeia archaeon]